MSLTSFKFYTTSLTRDIRWAETVHRTVPLIQTMRSHIMVPMPWSPVG